MLKFKHKKDEKLLASLHPILIMIYCDLFWYAKRKHNVELVVTETISNSMKDKLLKRVSKSHIEKRAIDIRTKNLDAFVLQDIVNYVNKNPKFRKYHYQSKSGIKRLAYYHIGTAEHIHLAIHSRYAIK